MRKKLTFALMAFFFIISMNSCFDSIMDIVNILENEYFTVENSEYYNGSIPASTSSEQMGTVSINSSVIPGGSCYITITTTQTMQEFYLCVNGVNGHLVVPAAAHHAGGNVYNLLLLISQNLHQSFTFVISGRTTGGTICPQITKPLERIAVGTGALQVSLSFNNNTDVDLYVVRPNGQVIYYGNTGGSDWGLDLDSNAACSIDGINQENIFFPTNLLLEGKYEVWVNLYENCNHVATTWNVRANRGSTLITPSFGSNPATGTFAANAPSNRISSSLNSSAVKVMEFSISGAADTKAFEDMLDYNLMPKSEKAILKEQLANDK